ncbi:hypothetical protein CERZMDRAFT_93237 [Cercospora zeae-maydis SCOH1-5]|uniref:Uncharacterized protein n=1 Tax=Cercospora zeae-maydis SCOH1-5 TaxID=717836 RepID=A0A6A6FV21_9PEZI|nr:hypothetical protein CERZMDRAFT_93237 [Cercospora zeae-maydis SCOH1-5]
MQSLLLTIFLGIFALLSSATPQLQCYSNKCNLLVRFKGKQACSSFLKTTVTPCPVTSTVTAASTVTVTSTSVTTQPTTVQTEVTVTEAPITITTTVTTFTATSTLRGPLPVQRLRRTDSRPPTCPKISSPSKVPDFFCGVCKTQPAFTAACKCLGVKPSTTTLPASTVSTTVTTQQTVTETSFTTVTSATTEESTTTAPASTVTVTNTVSTVSNAVASPTSCFLIGNSADSRFGQMQMNERFTFQTNSASAFALTGGTNGYLYDYFFRRTVGAVPPTPEQYPNDSVRLMRLVDINGPLATSIECVRAGSSLTCIARNGLHTRFVQCRDPGTLNDRSELVLLQAGFPVPTGCQEVTLRAEDVSCPPL